MVNIIVAVGNYVLDKGWPMGKNGAMPWNNKADLKWFKDTTTGHPVIMGRKTYEAIGHPLKNRTNIVVTSTNGFQARNGNDVKVVADVEEAIAYAKTIDEEIFIIGGASIFNYALKNNLVDRVYIDLLAEEVPDADTFFPDIVTMPNWEEMGEPIEIENRKAYAMTYAKVRGKNNHVDEQYLKLVNKIIREGVEKDTRAGKTRSLFAEQLRFNLKEGLPMLTTKKMFSKGVIYELFWFLKGDTNIKYLVDNGVHIWDDDAYRYYIECVKYYKGPDGYNNRKSKEDFLKFVKLGAIGDGIYNADKTPYHYGDLGPVYGKQWRNFGGVDQVKEVINKLRNNPDDRRIMLSAWNVGEINLMALPPCHYTCQFYAKKMTFDERVAWLDKHIGDVPYQPTDEFMDQDGVPRYKLSCMWQQRSVDSLLGLPFNILSYAILTHLIAHCVGMDVDELIFSGGDVHVYENQIEEYKRSQKNNNPHLYALPTLEINTNEKDIDNISPGDLRIIGYRSYPTVKYPLSVGL